MYQAHAKRREHVASTLPFKFSKETADSGVITQIITITNHETRRQEKLHTGAAKEHNRGLMSIVVHQGGLLWSDLT